MKLQQFWSLALLIPALVFAAPPKTPFANPDLARDYARQRADSYIRKIIADHERSFPAAFRYESIYYRTDFRRLSYVQQNLLAELLRQPKFLEEMQAREPMTNMTITVVNGITELPPPMLSEHGLRKVRANFSRSVLDRYVTDHLEFIERQLLHSFTNFADEFDTYDAQMVANYVMTQSLYAQNPRLTVSQLVAQFKKLEVGQIDYLKDRSHYEPLIAPLIARLKKVKRSKLDPQATVHKALAYGYRSIIETIYPRDNENSSLRLGEILSVREVHPNCSILRGYVGNDCSTLISPGFGLTPFDRYYYVYDQNERALGYVGLSIVEIDKRPAIFLHTIQGPDITAQQTKMILQAFTQLAPALGAQKVALGSDRKIDHNVNFPQIRRAMMSMAATGTNKPVKWLDHEYRKIIAKWDSEMTYDDPRDNQRGRLLPVGEDVTITVAQTPFMAEFTAPEKNHARMKCNLRLEW